MMIYLIIRLPNYTLELKMSETYLTTEQLAERIHYDPRTIRTRLKDAVLIECRFASNFDPPFASNIDPPKFSLIRPRPA